MPDVGFFDQCADRWDSMEVPDMGERAARVVALAGIGRGDAVLDVGCGTGVMAPPLLRAVGIQGRVVAFDLSQGMLRVARSKRLGPNTLLVLSDAERPAFASSAFDAVVCNAVFPHFGDRERALLALAACLKRGGKLVVSHPIGREAVNRIHSEHQEVAEDSVPPPELMKKHLSSAGLVAARVIDEPEFYYADASKP